MKEDNRTRIDIDKNKEKRTKEISKMISEGGLGANNYYDIHKTASTSTENDQDDLTDQSMNQ